MSEDIERDESLIAEEQHVLDKVIKKLDKAMLDNNKVLSRAEMKHRKAISKCLPDAYGDLVDANAEAREAMQKRRLLSRSRNELYQYHMKLHATGDEGEDTYDFKIGLHTYSTGAHTIILGWNNAACSDFVANPKCKETDVSVFYKADQRTYHTHYKLEMKREVDIYFDKVRNVIQGYPIRKAKKEEKQITDKFLRELLSRRSDTSFRNIVFSIQEQQGRIMSAPFEQEMIVQGCAGSGKSMIMLHRLPMLLGKMLHQLDKGKIYIITPSQTYIQRAHNMMIDLEIPDIPMGTIDQYYDYVLEAYQIKTPADNNRIYGRIGRNSRITYDQTIYGYSQACIDDMNSEMQRKITDWEMLGDDATIRRLVEKIYTQGREKSNTYSNLIQYISLQLQNNINEDAQRIEDYILLFRALLSSLEKICQEIDQGIQRVYEPVRASLDKRLMECESIEEEYTNVRGNGRSYEMKLSKLFRTACKKYDEIDDLKRKLVALQNNERVIALSEVKEKIEHEIAETQLNTFSRSREDIPLQLIYHFYDIRLNLCDLFDSYIGEISDYLSDFPKQYSGIKFNLNPLSWRIKDIRTLRVSFHNIGEYTALIKCGDYYANLQKSMVPDVYHWVMKKLDPDWNEKDALSCSAYLYTQLMYLFRGAPNSRKDDLITIDEVQSIAPAEITLIKKLNDNKVLLNLFGDVKQHIADTKGIDSWDEISSTGKYKLYALNENYRNCRQVTVYCNKRFSMNMQAINLDGNGVHEVHGTENLIPTLANIFAGALKAGNSCILVKSEEEAKQVVKLRPEFADYINDMVNGTGNSDLVANRWNLMTVEQAKGLEFNTVFAVSHHMGENEKYVAFTRALDCLYVFDDPLPVTGVSHHNDKTEDSATKVDDSSNTRTERKRRQRRSTENLPNETPLADFLKKAGLKVVDDRSHSGFLWVVGSKEDIGNAIEQAVAKYHISGEYSTSKVIRMRPGWYTKSKK